MHTASHVNQYNELQNSKNPKGPNGEGILFISGDFNKAITLSVERLHVKPLMKRAGKWVNVCICVCVYVYIHG